jgi:hypothetical protein
MKLVGPWNSPKWSHVPHQWGTGHSGLSGFGEIPVTRIHFVPVPDFRTFPFLFILHNSY